VRKPLKIRTTNAVALTWSEAMPKSATNSFFIAAVFRTAGLS